MIKRNRFRVAIDMLGLMVFISLLIVAQSGCAKQARKAKQPEKPASSKIMKTPSAKTPGPDPSSVDLSKFLSSGEQVMKKLFADVNKGGNKEIIFLSGKPWNVTPYEPGSVKIRILTWDGSKYIPYWEYQTIGEASGELWAEDINKDSIVEILSRQAMGAGSIALYIVAWNGSSYDLLKPIGPVGANPKDFFGPKGAKVIDEENDGVKEIYSHYGPAGSQADIYKWDGKNYTYSRTISIER